MVVLGLIMSRSFRWQAVAPFQRIGLGKVSHITAWKAPGGTGSQLLVPCGGRVCER